MRHFCVIQKDLEYLTEAVFVFYSKHLDKFIRENDKLWGDFCRRRVDRDGNVLNELELDMRSYEMTIPGMQVPMNKKTVIPEPEKYFSFSTKLMVMAIDLYEEEASPSFCHFTTSSEAVCGQQKRFDSSILQIFC